MPAFITRVELHGAQIQDYQNLHSYMQQAGFQTIILGDNGANYHLPPAEYYYSTGQEVSASAVRDHARTAASKTGILSAVITTKASEIAWVNLAAVAPPSIP